MLKKPVAVKLKCAQTFLFKSRCKFCRSGPIHMYFIMNKYIDEKNFSFFRKYYSDTANSPPIFPDEYYVESSVEMRNFKPSFMFDFNSIYLRKITPPNSKYEQEKDRFTSILECKCGRTTWAYTDSRRKHIKNRKNEKVAPTKNINSLYRIFI